MSPQAERLSRASVFISAHGASHANTLFMPTGAVVIEPLGCGHYTDVSRKLITEGGHFYLATMDATNANCTSNQAAMFGADDRELRREEWQPAVEEALRVLEGRVEAQAAGAHPHASHDDDAGGAA